MVSALTDPEEDTVRRLVGEISPLLAGHGPIIVGIVLADLTSMWLAGHQGPPELREDLLTGFVMMTRGLIEPNEQMLFQRIAELGRKH